MEAAQRPKCRDISDQGPVYKRYWAQWNLFALKVGMVERHWVSADGKEKTAQILIPHSRVKEVLAAMHGGTSGGHLGVKIIDKIRQRYYWLDLRGDVERFGKRCDTCAACRGPRTRSRGLIHQYNVGAPFEKIAIDIAGPLLKSDKGNISPDRHGLFHKVARSKCHSQPRSVDSSRRPGD